MDVQLIACNKIEFLKTSKELRTFSKEFAITLADSIGCEGMYNPICVRADPANPGHYVGVQGKHRFYATKVVLKEQVIACNVIDDMDDAEAEMAMIAENLWRNPLTKPQYVICIKKWWAHFQAKNPDRAVRGKAGGDASAKARAAKAGGDATAADEADDTFAAKVAASTGQSLSSAQRAQRLAQAFTQEQLEVFDLAAVTQTDMITIAKIKDEAQRGAVVNLIASGMAPPAAIKAVMGENAPVRDNGSGKAEAEAKATAKAEKVVELSDDEWFDKYCGEKANMLGDSARFKADALLYRKTLDQRHAHRTKIKAAIKAAAEAGTKGLLWFALNRYISFSNPASWLICDGCNGQGAAATGDKCKKCFSGGYLLKTEEYL